MLDCSKYDRAGNVAAQVKRRSSDYLVCKAAAEYNEESCSWGLCSSPNNTMIKLLKILSVGSWQKVYIMAFEAPWSVMITTTEMSERQYDHVGATLMRRSA